MKKVISCALLCAMVLVLFSCKDPVSQNPDDTPNSGGEITPNPGDGQENYEFDVTYTQDFTEDTGVTSTNYATTYNRALPNGSSILAVGRQDTAVIKRSLIMRNNESYSNRFKVSGVKGLGKISISYNSWLSSNGVGILELYVDDSLINTITGIEDYNVSPDIKSHVFTVENPNATSFTLKPAYSESTARIVIYNVTWTTTK